jgi:DNA-binding transcriptional LysR family regulator
MVAAAAQGIGIIFKPLFMVQDFIERGELVPILQQYDCPKQGVYAVYPHRRFLPAKIRTFIDFLKQDFAGL